MKFMNNKKGQFYIFIAIVLIAYAFNIARPLPLAKERPDVFKELYENFITESPVVLNNALYQGINISSGFTSFADSYADYAITRQPNFRFVYLLKDEGALVVGNKLGLSLNVSVANTSYLMSDDSTLTINPEDLTLSVAGISYDFVIGPESYQVKSLFRQKTSTETRIFVSK